MPEALFRDDPDFQVAIDRAARDLGEYAAFVEKDYWVTQLLRALCEALPNEFMLKGGTSLSKGYDIIRRFSEDVDILLVPTAGQSAKGVEARLSSITERVSGALGLPWEPARPPGRGRGASRGDLIHYPTVPERGLNLPITTDAVLLETGVGGGHEPSEIVEIRTIIGRWSGVAGSDFADLRPLRVRALEPRRTLIEKLSAVHHTVLTWDPTRPPNKDRFGRHYYDIYHLLGHRATLSRLTDRVRFGHILRDVEIISTESYGGCSERPEQGFAASAAFDPPSGSDLRRWLEESYRISLQLVSPSGPHPTFGEVLKRVAQHSALL